MILYYFYTILSECKDLASIILVTLPYWWYLIQPCHHTVTKRRKRNYQSPSTQIPATEVELFFESKPHNTQQKKTSIHCGNVKQKTQHAKNTIITLINIYTRNSTARDAIITISLHSIAVKLLVAAIAGAVPLAPIQIPSIVFPSLPNKI